MGTPLGPKYIPYTYMDPLGERREWCGASWREQIKIGVHHCFDLHAAHCPCYTPSMKYAYIPGYSMLAT